MTSSLARRTAVASLLLSAILVPFGLAQESAEELSPAQRYYLRGTELMNNRKLLDAVEQFQLAIDENPDYADAYRRLAYAYTEMAKTEADYYQDALDTYEDLEALLPEGDVDVKKSMAYVQAAMGEMDDAIATYETILEITPDDCAIWTQIAQAHRTQAEREKADAAGEETDSSKARVAKSVDAYTKIIDLCPEDVEAYKALGEMHFAGGRFDESAAVYAQLLEKDPENVDILSKLGYLYQKGKEWDKAAPVYKKLLELDPARVNDRMIYGQALKELGRFEGSAEQYRLVIESDAERKDVYCNLCFLYVEAKNGQMAVETGMKAISENAPQQGCLTACWAKGLELRAVGMYREGKYDNAISGYEEARLKFQTIQGDKDFGDYSTKQIERLIKLIEQAKAQKEKAKQEGAGNR